MEIKKHKGHYFDFFPIYFINLYYLNDNLLSGLLLDCCELIRKTEWVLVW